MNREKMARELFEDWWNKSGKDEVFKKDTWEDTHGDWLLVADHVNRLILEARKEELSRIQIFSFNYKENRIAELDLKIKEVE